MIFTKICNTKLIIFRKLFPTTPTAQGDGKKTKIKTQSSTAPAKTAVKSGVKSRNMTALAENKSAGENKLANLERALQGKTTRQERLLARYRPALRQLKEQVEQFKQKLESIQSLRQSVTVESDGEAASERLFPSEERTLSGGYNLPEVTEERLVPILGFPWQFDISDQEIKLPQDTTERFPVNCDFEDELNGWAIWYSIDTMNSKRTCKVPYDEELESNVVEFKRTGGSDDGSIIGIAQDVYIDLSRHKELYLQLDVKPTLQTIPGGGWRGGGEYPVCIELAFIDQNSVSHRWQHGFYYEGTDKYPTSTKVEEDAWFTYLSPNLKELIPLCGFRENVEDIEKWSGTIMHPYSPPVIPQFITRVLLFGGGWDFTGRADNLQFKTK